MPFAKRGAYPFTDHRNEKQAMSKDQTQKIQDLAKRLIEELHALGGDILTTVVVTQNQQALVVSNDNPANAVMGIVAAWTDHNTPDFGNASGINPAMYHYQSTAKH